MSEKEFKIWHARIKDAVSRYGSVVERMAIIAGCFEAMQAETRLTAGQVSEILKLRIKRSAHKRGGNLRALSKLTNYIVNRKEGFVKR